MIPLQKNNYIATKLFYRYLIPSILSLLAGSLNTLIDTVIVSNYTLIDGLAAMSIVAPVNLLYLTIGSTICVGASICFSTAVGEKNFEKARAYFGFAIVSVLIIGVVLTAVFLPLSGQIATLLGAKGSIFNHAKNYLFCYFCGGAFVMMLYVPHNFSKALGKPNVPLLLLSVMAVVNVVLTYIAVAVLKMGTGGAALATGIASAVAFVLGCFCIFGKKNKLKPTFFKLPVKEWKTTFMCGSAAGFNNFIRFAIVLGINSIITYAAISTLLPAYSIARSVQDLLLSVVLGISQSVMPLVAMYSGEKDNGSVRVIMKKALIIGLVSVTASVIIACLLNFPLQKFFGTQPNSANQFAIIFMCVALIPMFLNNLLASYFSAIKRYKFSQLIMILRVAFTLLIGLLFAFFPGGNALWICFVAGEILVLVAFVVLLCVYTKKNTHLDKLLLEKKYDNLNNRLSFSIRADEAEIVSASEKASIFFEEKNASLKILMRLSLAIEELLIAIVKKKAVGENAFIDISIFYDEDGIVMRFRYGGKCNNPFDLPVEVDVDNENFGIAMLKKTISDTQHYWLFGLNNLVVIL